MYVDKIEESAKLKTHLDKLKEDYKDSVTINYIKGMVQEQCKLFDKVRNDVDLRNVIKQSSINNRSYLLDEYLHKPLVSFFEQISLLDQKNSKLEQKSLHHKRLKVQMVVSILCNITNRNCLLLQTVIGHCLYAGGLRDKVFDILSTFGITCSLEQIRKHIAHWSAKRNILDEIKCTSFWRISFDNLNFLRKYAKTFLYGAATAVAGKMLNVLTSQVTHRSCPTELCTDNDRCYTNSQNAFNDENDFFLKFGTPEHISWNLFSNKSLHHITERVTNKGSPTEKPLLIDLEKDMPHFTPDKGDTVAYGRVETAQASSIDDVCSFLLNLKQDLHIGTPGYPEKCVVAGDQQTFVVMSNLKYKFPNTFTWMCPFIGDWHLLKLSSETLQNILSDGGFRDMAKSCKYYKDVHQWKDIHRILNAMYEGLYLKLVAKFHWDQVHNGGSISFDAWVSKLSMAENNDEVSH
jgi:hypothetical protein